MISTRAGTGSGFTRFPLTIDTPLVWRESVDDVRVDIVEGAILPPLILPVPLLLLLWWDTTVVSVEVTAGTFNSNATGQLIVTFKEQLLM